jgi:hypothetical protein
MKFEFCLPTLGHIPAAWDAVPELISGESINANNRPELWCDVVGQNLPRMIERNQNRAARYRRLALAEPNKEKSSLLNRIADEAERGVLWVADRDLSQPSQPPPRRVVDTD